MCGIVPPARIMRRRSAGAIDGVHLIVVWYVRRVARRIVDSRIAFSELVQFCPNFQLWSSSRQVSRACRSRRALFLDGVVYGYSKRGDGRAALLSGG